jgi:hypothetical protein
MKDDYFTIFDRVDPDWAQEQAKEIFETMPRFQRGVTTAKFYNNYETWKFVKGSKVPLIKKFFELSDEHNEKFKHLYGRELNIHVCRLTYVRNASDEISVWHKDGKYLNGNTHLTIKGNCNLLIKDDECVTHLQVPNGTYFYFSATKYHHTVKPTSGERIEACGFIDEYQSSIDAYYAAAENSPYKLCDNTHPAWIEHQFKVYDYMKDSYAEGRASAEHPADWPQENKNED